MIGRAGTLRRQAVDISPLYDEASFRNINLIAECLADS